MRMISYQSHDAWSDATALGGLWGKLLDPAREGGPASAGG